MMGRLNRDQKQLFYAFDLDEAVPDDHPVRQIARMLDLSWVRTTLAPRYSHTGRPSVDPELMLRMLILGYIFAIRSERQLVRDVRVNLAYRWFCGLGLEDNVPDHSAFSAPATNGSGTAISCANCLSGLSQIASQHGWSAVKASRLMRA